MALGGQPLERSQAALGAKLCSGSAASGVWAANFLVALGTAIAPPYQYFSVGTSGSATSRTASTHGLADLQALSQ
jgi:hypothetical protein